MADDQVPVNTKSYSLIAFHIGPPQEYISYSRSVRDLWSGSAILSWLSFMAMTPILGETENDENSKKDAKEKKQKEIIFPVLDETPPYKIWDLLTKNKEIDETKISNRATCIPNRFVASVPKEEDAIKLAEECEKRVKASFLLLSYCVKKEFQKEVEKVLIKCAKEKEECVDKGSTTPKKCCDFFTNWDAQVESYFEIRTTVINYDVNGVEKLPVYEIQKNNKKAEWIEFTFLYDYISKLQETKRNVKHFPKYEPKPDADGNYAPKCSVMGTYEQMGPADFKASRCFWEELSIRVEGDKNKGVDVNGIHIHSGERFSALQILKRFAPVVSEHDVDVNDFTDFLKKYPDHLEIAKKGVKLFSHLLNTARIPDTYTVAASDWLYKNNFKWLNYHKNWNGSWLHMKDQVKRDSKEKVEETVPDDVWKLLQKIRKQNDYNPPPTYYAILVMDGDKIGEWLQGKCVEKNVKLNKDYYKNISRSMVDFSVNHATKIVSDNHGELVYSGGDDVLALLPVDTVLKCAKEIEKAFKDSFTDSANGVTLSAGIAIVHVKEDLRRALKMARDSEHKAKSSGRNILNISVVHPGGEPINSLCPWDMTDTFQSLVDAFKKEDKNASDRWAYQLREELLPLLWDDKEKEAKDAFLSEVKRIFSRTDNASFEIINAQFNSNPTDDIKKEFERIDNDNPIVDDKRKASIIKKRAVEKLKYVAGIFEEKLQIDGKQRSVFIRSKPEDKEDQDKYWQTHFVNLCLAASFMARGRTQE